MSWGGREGGARLCPLLPGSVHTPGPASSIKFLMEIPGSPHLPSQLLLGEGVCAPDQIEGSICAWQNPATGTAL